MPDSARAVNAPVNSWRQSGWVYLWISALCIVLDQITKLVVLENMALYESIPLTGFFNLTYVRNFGAAFSFLSDAGGWQRWFFTALAVGVSLFILWWLRQNSRQQKLLSVAFSFILGGAIGNVIDRIAYGYVVDFLDVYVGSYHWPAFNVADSAIFIGACLLILDWLKNGEQKDD